jgi:hypothetical protein
MALRKKKSLTPFKKSGSVESAALINSWQDFGAATPPVLSSWFGCSLIYGPLNNMVLVTKLTQRLGITHPIIQGVGSIIVHELERALWWQEARRAWIRNQYTESCALAKL